MEAYVNTHPDVHVRRVDVVSWTSAVAVQHAIRRLPHLLLYDANGKLLAEGTREVLDALP